MSDTTVPTNYSKRIQQTTFKNLQVLRFFDILCLIISTILIFLSNFIKDLTLNRSLLMQIGGVVGVFGSISAICNCFTNYGIKAWRRCFLLPSLTFLLVVLVMLLMYLVRLFIMSGISEALVLPLFTGMVMVYIWLKLLKQWFFMSKPLPMISPPTQEDIDAQALAWAMATGIAYLNLSLGQVHVADSATDLPPKYETLEADLTAPPGYDEVVQIGQEVHQPVLHDDSQQAVQVI